MKKGTCKNCPFLRANEWRGGWVWSKISALETIEESGNVFACHSKHPDNHVYSGKPMIHNDCRGFAKMLENMKETNKHPEVVNNVLETNPTGWNYKGHFISEGKNISLINQISQC